MTAFDEMVRRKAKAIQEERIAYVVRVLWLKGDHFSVILAISGYAAATVQRALANYPADERVQLSVEQRQALLDELKLARNDNGKLEDIDFIAGTVLAGVAKEEVASIMASRPRARRMASGTGEWFFDRREHEAKPAPPDFDLSTKAGKKAKRVWAKSEERARIAAEKAEARQSEMRQQGYAPRGTDAIPFESMFKKNLLRDPDSIGDAAGGRNSNIRRWEVGRRFRSVYAGCLIGSMASPDLEGASGAGGPPKPMSVFRLECFQTLGIIRGLLSTEEFRTVESVLEQDRHLFAELHPEIHAPRERAAVLEDFRRSLDVCATVFNLMTYADFRNRWGEDLRARAQRLEPGDAWEMAPKAGELFRSGN